MENKKEFECTISMSYLADDPIDAAKQFIANIQTNPNWYVQVKDINSNFSVMVDTENDFIE